MAVVEALLRGDVDVGGDAGVHLAQQFGTVLYGLTPIMAGVAGVEVLRAVGQPFRLPWISSTVCMSGPLLGFGRVHVVDEVVAGSRRCLCHRPASHPLRSASG